MDKIKVFCCRYVCGYEDGMALSSSEHIFRSERYASLKAGIFLGQSPVSLPDSSDEVACKASKAKPAT